MPDPRSIGVAVARYSGAASVTAGVTESTPGKQMLPGRRACSGLAPLWRMNSPVALSSSLSILNTFQIWNEMNTELPLILLHN